MTLAEMADFVCTKVRANDALALAACKTYLRQRYEMVYNDQLWRDSLYSFTFSIPMGTVPDDAGDPNQDDVGALGIYFMPLVVDRVIAVRKDGGELPVVDEGEMYQTSLDEYAETGSSVNFAVMSPAVAMVAVADQDNAPFTLECFAAGDNSKKAAVRWLDGFNRPHKTEVTLSFAAPVEFGNADGVGVVESITFAAAPDAVVHLHTQTVLGQTTLSFAAAGETSFPQRTRIRIFPKPAGTGEAYRALIKRKVLPLEDDSDTPLLRGVDNLLMAFAQADMLQRARRYAQAGVVQQEALALFEQFKRMEVAQQSHRQRFVPEVTEVSGESQWLPGKGWV